MMIISFIEEKVHIKCIVSEGLQSSSSYNSGPRSYESSYNAPIRYLIFCFTKKTLIDCIFPYALKSKVFLCLSFRDDLKKNPGYFMTLRKIHMTPTHLTKL